MKHCPEHLLSFQGRVDAQGNCRSFQWIKRGGERSAEVAGGDCYAINGEVEEERKEHDERFSERAAVAQSGSKLLKNAFDVSSDEDDDAEPPVSTDHIAIHNVNQVEGNYDSQSHMNQL